MIRFRRTPLLFEVGVWFAGGSGATPPALDVIAALLRRQRIRLPSPSKWDLLVIDFEPRAAKRKVTRSRAMGWITCKQPLLAAPGELTFGDLPALVHATHDATAEVAAQLTPEDVLTSEQLNAHVAHALSSIPKRSEDLESFVEGLARDHDAVVLRRLAEDDAATSACPRPTTTLIRGMRGYGHFPGFPYNLDRELGAFAWVLGGRMRGERLRLPGYLEIYLHLAPHLAEALGAGEPQLSWHRNAYAVLDLEVYYQSDPTRRLELLIEATEQALERLVRVDHLDARAIATCLAAVAKLGAERTFALDVLNPPKP